MQPNERTQPEPLTIAYMAMGVQNTIRAQPGGILPDRVTDYYGGELNFIDAVISFALELDRMADEYGAEGLPGVFSYEVAEPFGEQYAAALIAGVSSSHAAEPREPRPIAAALFREMIRAGSCTDCIGY